MPNNLPVRLTSFVGREAEIADVGRLLAQTRLLTLTGSGGCGKSSLAVRVASDHLGDRPDGTWFVDLAALGDPLLLPAAVASALAIREPPGVDLVQVLQERLRPLTVLLVVDNCEHLLAEASALIESLLRACPALRVLTTSRELLGAEGETAFRVPSLSIPAEDATLNMIALSEAVRLFVERVRQVRPDFVLSDGEARTVAEICRRLDGIPLAIELAAARARVMSAQQILEGLTDRFGLLTGGMRTALPRHRTLQGSVDWSYELLSNEERALLRRLAVFAGTFSLEAAQEICSGEGIERRDMLDLLTRLVDRSLVQTVASVDAVRYRLLETIRQYAGEKLTEAGEDTSYRDRHLDFFLMLAEAAEKGFEGTAQLASFERLDLEHPNLRAAGEWAASEGQDESELRLAGALWIFYTFRSHLTELRLRVVERLPPRVDIEPSTRAKAYLAMAWYCFYSGDLPRGAPAAEEAVSIGRASSNPRTLALGLHALGWNDAVSGRQEARAHLEEAADVARDAGDLYSLGFALSALGFLLFVVGETQLARRTLDEALIVGRRIGHLAATHQALTYLGLLQSSVGEYDRAEATLEEGMRVSRELGDLYFLSMQSSFLTEALISSGRFEAARRIAADSQRWAREANSGPMIAVNFAFEGMLDAHVGDLDSAMRHLDQALEFMRAGGYGWATPQWLVLEGSVLLLKGDLDGAGDRFARALELARETANALALAQALQARASLARLLGDVGSADGDEHEALEVSIRCGLVPAAIDSIEALAGTAAGLGRSLDAARLLGAAESKRRAISYVRAPMRAPVHAADVQAVREALGEESFEAAWREGEAMTFEQAAALAGKGRGARKRPSVGWASLTPVELDVVKLAARGLTNPQIGEKLFISRRTVQTHLARVFRKVGVASRAELAAEAVRRGV